MDGIVRVTDRSAGAGGRAYLVERELQTKGELNALVADYLQVADRLQEIPMASAPLERYLEHLT